MFIDKDVIKSSRTFAEVIGLLKLDLTQSGNQWRGTCPVCKKERGLVVTEGKGAFCFGTKQGGDVVWLVQHTLSIPFKDALHFLEPTVEEEAKKGNGKLQPLSYLQPENEMVAAVGFSTEFAKTHGIGYAPKGLMKGSVAIPFRDQTGTLLGYIGILEAAVLPKDFK